MPDHNRPRRLALIRAVRTRFEHMLDTTGAVHAVKGHDQRPQHEVEQLAQEAVHAMTQAEAELRDPVTISSTLRAAMIENAVASTGDDLVAESVIDHLTRAFPHIAGPAVERMEPTTESGDVPADMHLIPADGPALYYVSGPPGPGDDGEPTLLRLDVEGTALGMLSIRSRALLRAILDVAHAMLSRAEVATTMARRGYGPIGTPDPEPSAKLGGSPITTPHWAGNTAAPFTPSRDGGV